MEGYVVESPCERVGTSEHCKTKLFLPPWLYAQQMILSIIKATFMSGIQAFSPKFENSLSEECYGEIANRYIHAYIQSCSEDGCQELPEA